VRAIEAGSPASETQLRPNDVITDANRHHVAGLKELRAAAKDQSTLLLTVHRGSATLFIAVR